MEAEWEAWEPGIIAERLAGVGVPWCVVGGWALDLFRGERTRPHDDIEIAVPASGFAAVAARFGDCDFYVAKAGQVTPVTDEALETSFQTWAQDRAAGVWRFDVFREPHDGDTWIYRRDARIRRPYTEVIRHDAAGVPYLAPEIVLLFKTKDTRDKDRFDIDATLPMLDGHARRWLAEARELRSE